MLTVDAADGFRVADACPIGRRFHCASEPQLSTATDGHVR